MVGYRRLTTSDPKEQRLRDAWYSAKATGDVTEAERIHDELSSYLWNRTQAEVEADRKKHPKARRNLPVGSEIGKDTTKAQGGGRAIP